MGYDRRFNTQLGDLGSPSNPGQSDMLSAISTLQGLLASAPNNLAQSVLNTQTTSGPTNTVQGVINYYTHSNISAYYSRDYALLQNAIATIQAYNASTANASVTVGQVLTAGLTSTPIQAQPGSAAPGINASPPLTSTSIVSAAPVQSITLPLVGEVSYPVAGLLALAAAYLASKIL